MNVTIKNDALSFRNGLEIRFMRTLRIPDDGNAYPLPAGFGTFPIRRVDDYQDRVPAAWRERGGVFIPMYQREAMWISFGSTDGKSRAVKIGVGKVCAVTGKKWTSTLDTGRQNYVVTPLQPWLDGIATGRGTIRQFVAMPLGLGYTVEGQVTGEETHGGLQLQVFEPRKGGPADRAATRYRSMAFGSPPTAPACAVASKMSAGTMGVAAGGTMRQKIYPDPYGIVAWDATRHSRAFVHIVNSELWREITGEEAPRSPITAKEYERNGVPWFELYDEHASTVAPSAELANVKSIKTLDGECATLPLQDDEPLSVGKLTQAVQKFFGVRDGDW